MCAHSGNLQVFSLPAQFVVYCNSCNSSEGILLIPIDWKTASLAEPQSRSLDALFAPELRTRWIGVWDFFALFVISSLLNNFLSDEFLFRGVLLTKMKGVFGKWNWVTNGFIFGLYHLHMPWGIPGNILFGCLMAFIAKRYRTNWFPIILHNGQALFFGFLIPGLVMGLA